MTEVEDKKKAVREGARRASAGLTPALSLTPRLDKRRKRGRTPHLGRQNILETNPCAFQHETPDKETEKDDVGKEY